MNSSRRGKISPRQLRSTLVVKRTFLELEGRSISPDARDDDEGKPKSGLRFRASSDPAIFNLVGEEVTGELEPPEPLEPNTADDELPSAELVLTGLSEDDAETESTASVPDEPHTDSFSGLSGCASSRSASKEVQLRSRSPGYSRQDADTPPRISQNSIARLADENARLALENMTLKQHCLEVAKAAQQAAQKSAPKSENVAPRSDCVLQYPGMPVGSYVWVPMDCSMRVGQPVFPMASPSASDGRMLAAQSAAVGKPSQQEPAAQIRGRRGSRAARAEQMFAKHAAAVASKKSAKSHEESIRAHNEEAYKQPALEDLLREPLDSASQDIEPSQQGTCPPHLRTTVMVRNLPNNYSRQMLMDLINSEGFAKSYDFIYLPIDFKSRASLGYAFVNLTNHQAAKRFRDMFDGFSNWILPSRKVCGVNWSGPHQGLEAHIERYRNSPVMHEAVPDIYKPALFVDGQRAVFPPPTKKLRAPTRQALPHWRHGFSK